MEVLYDRGLVSSEIPAGLEFFLRLPVEVQYQVVEYIRFSAYQASKIAETVDLVIINPHIINLCI